MAFHIVRKGEMGIFKVFFLSVVILLNKAVAAAPGDGPCVTSVKAALHGVYRDARGKIIPRMPMGKDPVVVDTNIIISMAKKKYSPERAHQAEVAWVNRFNRMFKRKNKKVDEMHLYMAERSVTEQFVSSNRSPNIVFPERTRIFEIEISRSSPQYQQVLSKLESLSVGQVKANSGNDREIVADLFFARRSHPEDIPTFVTADRGIYGPLCQFAPACAGIAGNNHKLVKEAFPDGYIAEVNVGGIARKVRVVPF